MVLSLLFLPGLTPDALAARPEIEVFRAIAVQDGGRVKPLDTFARELARQVRGATPFGFDRVAGLEPAEWVLSLLARPDEWRSRRLIRVTHAQLRQVAGLARERERFSFDELAGDAGLRRAVAAVQARTDAGEELGPLDREVLQLQDTLITMAGTMTGAGLRIVPRPEDPAAAWYSIRDLASGRSEAAPRIVGPLTALLTAYRDGDETPALAAAAALSRRLSELAPDSYPSRRDLAIEIHYNSLKPYRLAWMLYLVAFLLLLSSYPLAASRLAAAGFALILAAFVLSSYGMALRILISGRPPVTNMYETLVFVAWGGVLFALLFEAIYRVRLVGTCAAAVGTIALLLADNVAIFDSGISPLVPVLRDNWWLTIHVLTIMLGYGACTLAMSLGHLTLGLHLFAPQKAALLKTLSTFLYRTLQIGTLFLATGTLLGGVWASYSWGRFWGWDPKETWALIATLGYLAILHGRFVGWVKDLGLAVGSVLAYLLVLMAWYGVNFVLGTGLHSYGFGTGGYWYVGSFVAFELLVITAALAQRRISPARPASRAPASVGWAP